MSMSFHVPKQKRIIVVWLNCDPRPKARAMTEFEAMLLSVVVEGPIAFVIVRFTGWPCRGPLHVALAASLATAATHPQLWAVTLWLAPRFGYELTVATLEAAVILVEAMIIAWASGLSAMRALVVSVATNATSFAAGLLLSA
jgi:hypothetical protein